jgi:hypothetical protein
MQVSHANDRVTHAVIAPKAAEGFGISDSAEFIHVLSDTLYSDKPLAVIREVLCNAWDSHIVTGRQKRPVLVTITDKFLTIQDFGTGIHRSLIQSIYCVYGNSTKKNDGNQTGGFGLGSKAPFAYTDSFEVTSCHEGTKTIYQVSKSSAEVGGRPGITEIVSVPTDYSGITVKIPLKEQRDAAIFTNIVRTIARNGEMNVELNGQVCETLPFSEGKDGWIMVLKDNRHNDSTMAVRYGNVLYPVPQHEAYADFYKSITEFMSALPNSGNVRLIFMAEPNTISVTPSRESLSMSDITVDTLKKHLSDFCFDFNKVLEIECRVALKTAVDNLWLTHNISPIFESTKSIPGVTVKNNWGSGPQIDKPLVNVADIVSFYLKTNYPSFSGFHKFDQMYRMRAFLQSGAADKPLVNKYLRALRRNYAYGAPTDNTFFHKEIIWPIMKKVRADPELNSLKLSVYNFKDTNGWGEGRLLKDVSAIKQTKLTECLPFLRKIVVLTHRASDYQDRAGAFPIFRRLGKTDRLLVCTVSRSKNKIAAARKIFSDLGYHIVDLTVKQPWEKVDLTVPINVLEDLPPVPKKPKGLPSLASVTNRRTGEMVSRTVPWEHGNRIEAPRVIVRGSRNGHMTFTHMNQENKKWFVKKFGQVTGVAVSTTQEDKYIKQGSLNFRDFFESEFLYYLCNNVSFRQNLPFSDHHLKTVAKIDSYEESHRFLRLVSGDPVLSAKFGLRDERTEDHKGWLDFWLAYKRWYVNEPSDYSKRPKLAQIRDILNSMPPYWRIEDFKQKCRQSDQTDFLSTSALGSALNGTNYLLKLKARQLLINVLKG